MADDFDHAMKALENISGELDHLTDAELMQVGHVATNIIVERTRSGVDVDHRPFKAYSDDYAKQREHAGYGVRPDLVRTGHMLGALLPKLTGPGEVSVLFASAQEATKAAAHNYGVNKTETLIPNHSRSTYVDSKGRRASRDEIAKDKRRKNKQLTQRTENVSSHQRKMNTPQREFMDIRDPREVEAIGEAIGKPIQLRLEKSIK